MRIAVLEDDATQVERYTLWFPTAQHQCSFYGAIAELIADVGYVLRQLLPGLGFLSFGLALR
jgi:hypothetical protein